MKTYLMVTLVALMMVVTGCETGVDEPQFDNGPLVDVTEGEDTGVDTTVDGTTEDIGTDSISDQGCTPTQKSNTCGINNCGNEYTNCDEGFGCKGVGHDAYCKKVVCTPEETLPNTCGVDNCHTPYDKCDINSSCSDPNAVNAPCEPPCLTKTNKADECFNLGDGKEHCYHRDSRGFTCLNGTSDTCQIRYGITPTECGLCGTFGEAASPILEDGSVTDIYVNGLGDVGQGKIYKIILDDDGYVKPCSADCELGEGYIEIREIEDFTLLSVNENLC